MGADVNRTSIIVGWLLALAAAGSSVAAAPPDTRKDIRPPYVPDSPELSRCEARAPQDRNGTQWGGIVGCLRQELARQDKRLNEAYGVAKAGFSERGADKERFLVEGQRAWIAYRDAWCRVQANSGEAPPPELLELACKVELTVEQLGRLEDQRP